MAGKGGALMLRLISAFLAARRARRARAWVSVVEQVIPSKPLVGAHQLQALRHAQLAAEIGWKGPRHA